MIRELADFFQVIQSVKCLENYSDKGGEGISGISVTGIGNETLAFSLRRGNSNNDDIPVCKILELCYIGKKLGIQHSFFSMCNVEYFIKPEGAEIKEMIFEWREYFKQAKTEDLIIDIKSFITKLNEQDKIVFFQDRLDWKRLKDEKFYYYRRRLALRVCDKGVTILKEENVP